MLVRASPSALKEGRWYEYLIRFALGGAATMFAGWVASRFGPLVGGLFLAMPAIFCASATLIETHEARRKREAGVRGERRGKQAAALDAAGAALGGVGLVVFAVVFAASVERSPVAAFVFASAAWLSASIAAWWLRHKLRSARNLAANSRAVG
ncbi:hypothetical protein [Bradyrhizobium sp.]